MEPKAADERHATTNQTYAQQVPGAKRHRHGTGSFLATRRHVYQTDRERRGLRDLEGGKTSTTTSPAGLSERSYIGSYPISRSSLPSPSVVLATSSFFFSIAFVTCFWYHCRARHYSSDGRKFRKVVLATAGEVLSSSTGDAV